MKHYLLILFLLSTLSASRLAGQTDDSWKLYSDTGLARIDITIDTASLSWIYAHVDSDSEHYAQIHFSNAWIDESVDSIGFRLRGNTSRDAQKKSFKVSFNSFIKGRRFHGVKKLNLNGEHNDPSIIRSKLCFDLYRDIGMAASRAAHAKVYINGAYYGLYVSVEDVGEDFLTKRYADDSGNLWKCLYPADLQYLGEDPAVYAAQSSDGRPVYELQTNETANDFSQIVRLARILHQTPSGAMADSLESVIDVPIVLKYFAMNVLVGSWDDYRSLMNNYYLYHNPAENRLTIIPYDYDNTFGVDWFSIDWSTANPYDFPKVGAGPRPLSEALFAQNQYKDLFTHFLKFYNTNLMPLSRWEARIDRIRDTISSAAIEDTYRTRDYGFTVSDFYNSYSTSSYQNQHVKFGLKQFVNLRTSSLPAQLSFMNAPPLAYWIFISSDQPGPNDSVVVAAACFGYAGVKKAEVLYTPKDSTSPRVYPMQFSPVSGTTVVEDADRWTATLPPLGYSAKGTIRIRVTDSLDRVQSTPRVTPIAIQTPGQASGGLIMNELLADNVHTIADQNGEYDDWLELYNPTTSPILLTGLYLTDNPAKLSKWRFTQAGLYISAGEHLLIWCDDQQTQAGIHTNFKFSKSGEYAAIVDTDGITVIDSISFGPQDSDISLGRFPDAGSLWGKMRPTPQATNSDVHGAGAIQIHVSRQWNLISVPMKVANGTTTLLYPDAASSAFAYQAGYHVMDSLQTGTGYWLKFNSEGTIVIPGTIFTVETLAVQAGWNMIGALSKPIPVSGIATLTPGLTTGSLFKYQDGYFPVDTLEPGRGYWVKASKAGLLRIAFEIAVPSANRLQIIPDGELPPAPPGNRPATTAAVPENFALEQNYPNPFNPATQLRFALPVKSNVKLSIYNILGQVVATLIDGELEAGYREVVWNASTVASGIYIYRIQATAVNDPARHFSDVGKMALVR
jgi:hypothetical protein